MTQDKISALLGRSLSTLEVTNFKTYLSLAQSRISDILCSEICAEHDTKEFDPRIGYRTLNVPIFSDITSVKVNGTETTDYKIYQGSKLNGDWFNSIVFKYPVSNTNVVPVTVEVEADWGFYNTPIDIQQMIAEQFGMMTTPLGDDIVTRKQVEDFSIYTTGTISDAFTSKYAATIAKYSGCVHGSIDGTPTRGFYRGFGYERIYGL